MKRFLSIAVFLLIGGISVHAQTQVGASGWQSGSTTIYAYFFKSEKDVNAYASQFIGAYSDMVTAGVVLDRTKDSNLDGKIRDAVQKIVLTTRPQIAGQVTDYVFYYVFYGNDHVMLIKSSVPRQSGVTIGIYKSNGIDFAILRP